MSNEQARFVRFCIRVAEVRKIVERQKTVRAIDAFNHRYGAVADVKAGKTIERHVHDGADQRFDCRAMGNERDALAAGSIFFGIMKRVEHAALNGGHAFPVWRSDAFRIGKVCGGCFGIGVQ